MYDGVARRCPLVMRRGVTPTATQWRMRSGRCGTIVGSPPVRMTPAWARYLNASLQTFLDAGDRLPEAAREPHRRAVPLVERAWARQQRETLACFAAPGVGAPLHCLSLREALPAFAARIDTAAARIV